jgi:two-component sensor histidine kinase
MAGEQPFASFTGNSRMARLVREFDWAATPLGPLADWSTELKTLVSHMLESNFPAAIVWGSGLVTIYNDAFRPILGSKPEALGRSFAEVWAEAWDEIGPIAERAFAGESTYIEDFPLVVDRSGRPEQAWFTFCYSPLRLADGTVAGMMDTVVETTKTVRTLEERDGLNRELGHRLQNMIAMVQAIASQSLRRVAERDAVDAFVKRIVALGRAQDVLIRRSWSAASLDEVARATLSLLDGLGQIAIEGPVVQAGTRSTMALSLVLNELATNAAKYGALSVPAGRVTLSWTVEGDTVRICWREAGGPEVREPTHTGLGSRLIDMGLGPRGAVRRSYPKAGFEAVIEAPMADLRNG